MMPLTEVTIVGGGIVGLATAHALVNGPSKIRPDRIVLLDKEAGWGRHQTGHNSGVIHSGLYYQPGSTKAAFARAGAEALYRFCAEHGVPGRRTGKVVVATRPEQLPRLAELARRGTANGVQISTVDSNELRELEPRVRGLRALHVPEAGITDFGAVADTLATQVAEAGVELRPATELRGVHTARDELVLETTRGELRTRRAVNCAGLHSDVVAEWAGTRPAARMFPFRGEYYETVPAQRDLVRALVYPVPDPALPFLGVHLTRMIDGGLHVGPNAVPALTREGYRWRDFSAAHLRMLLGHPGVPKLARRYWRFGIAEIARSACPPLFVRAARELLPEINGADLRRCGSGVRAQAVTENGRLVDDFLVQRDRHWVHVLNAPSPAATASLRIGQHIADLVAED